MGPSAKSKVAGAGMLAGICAFVAVVPMSPDSTNCAIWILLAGGVATVFSWFWGTRLVRITGIGFSLVCFGGATLLLDQESDLDLELARIWRHGRNGNGQPCTCGAKDWAMFSPTNRSFSILMPGHPSEALSALDASAGQLAVLFFTAQPTPDVAFTVGQSQFSVDAEAMSFGQRLDQARDQLIQAYGRPFSETRVLVRGRLGREWRFEKNDGATTVTVRAFITDNGTFLQAICVMPKAKLCKKHLELFLGSFQFDEGSGISTSN